MSVIQFPKRPPPPGGFELPRALVAELAQGIAGAVLSGCNRLVAADTAADFAAAIAELHHTLADNAEGFADLVAQTRAWTERPPK
jgi:hypothetical protein